MATVDGYQWKDSPGQTFDWESLLERLQNLEDNKFALEIHRDQNDGRSFSPDAVETLARACMTFVLARCDAYWKETHEPPSNLKLIFALELDHERSPTEHDKLGSDPTKVVAQEGDGPMDH